MNVPTCFWKSTQSLAFMLCLYILFFPALLLLVSGLPIGYYSTPPYNTSLSTQSMVVAEDFRCFAHGT